MYAGRYAGRGGDALTECYINIKRKVKLRIRDNITYYRA